MKDNRYRFLKHMKESIKENEKLGQLLAELPKLDTKTQYNTPSLILISGPPGCGKSTLADALASKIGAFVLDKDCIDDLFSPDDRGPRYTKEIEPKVLQGLLNLAERNLQLGHSVILDIPWTHIMLNSPEWIERIQMLAKKNQAKLIVLECVIPEAALRKRLATRGLKRDQVKLTPEGWEHFKEHDRIGAKNPLPHYVIDVERPAEECLKKAQLFIELAEEY